MKAQPVRLHVGNTTKNPLVAHRERHNMRDLNAVAVWPDGGIYEITMADTLESFQGLVGGCVQCVFGEEHVIYVNEEGLLQSLPFNRRATEFANRFVAKGHLLYGVAVIVGPADSEGNNTNVHPDVASQCVKL